MKKSILLFVSIIALASCGNTGNIENDVINAFELSEKYVNQCANHYYDESYRLVKGSKTIDDSTLNEMEKNIENDVNGIIKKVFDPLFEKYGDEKTLVAINEFIDKESYKAYNDELFEKRDTFVYCSAKYMQVYVLKKVAEGMETAYTESLTKF